MPGPHAAGRRPRAARRFVRDGVGPRAPGHEGGGAMLSDALARAAAAAGDELDAIGRLALEAGDGLPALVAARVLCGLEAARVDLAHLRRQLEDAAGVET